MAQTRKYAALPDLDTAPDVFETVQTGPDGDTGDSSPPSPNKQGDSDDPDESGINRTHISASNARSRFRPARVSAKDADFSDRIASGPRSYSIPKRRRRRILDELAGHADDSEESEEELDEKIARLRREIEEAKAQAQQTSEDDEGKTRGKQRDIDELAELSSMLQDLKPPPSTQQPSASSAHPLTNGISIPKPSTPPAPLDSAMLQRQEASTKQALTKALDIESRLAHLESVLGLPHVALADATAPKPDPTSISSSTPSGTVVLATPVLPTLTRLAQNLRILSSTTGPSLESMSQQIQALTRDAEKLEEARKAAKAAHDALASPTGEGPGRPGSVSLSNFAVPGTPTRTPRRLSRQLLTRTGSEVLGDGSLPPGSPRQMSQTSIDGVGAGGQSGQGAGAGGQGGQGQMLTQDPETASQIAALYGVLPTVEALAPLLPATLERLRSLRILHADAAGAAENLAAVEKRQSEMARELQEWRAALERVEKAVDEGAEKAAGNRSVVEEWIKDIEARVKALD